jgi:UPF0755 protein
MGLFDRKPPQRDRTAAERERARAEREARRARQRGEPVPPLDPTPPEPAAVEEPRVSQPPVLPRSEIGEPARASAPAPPPAPAPRPAPPPPPAPAQQPDPPRSPVAIEPVPTPPVHSPASESGSDGDGAIGSHQVTDVTGSAAFAPSSPAAPGMYAAEDWHEEPVAAPPPPPRRPLGAWRQRGSVPPSGRISPGARVAAAAAAVIVLLLAWFLLSLFQPFKGDGHGRLTVAIPRGASAHDIGNLLSHRGIVSSGTFFALRARLAGKTDIKAGTYVLARGMSYGAALDKLGNGPPTPTVVRITIPEGRSRLETVPLVARTSLRGSYLAATRHSPLLDPRKFGAPRRTSNLEGFLFPATYELKPGAPVSQLVGKQLTAFKLRFATVDMRAARHKNLTPFDVVTIASMVEREAELDRDRPLIAAVIYNRLKQGIPLGIDSTLRFALNDWTKPLTRSQLALRNPYNTRLHQGLPPGPIGNPGIKSLQAAAHPAHVSYLYFVVKPCAGGGHAFSSTNAQFQRDAARYDVARTRKGGRSPTKCG